MQHGRAKGGSGEDEDEDEGEGEGEGGGEGVSWGAWIKLPHWLEEGRDALEQLALTAHDFHRLSIKVL